MEVLVLGAGIVGLTSALELARAGHEVVVGARERTPETTSDVAAAIHYPFLARPKRKVLAWGRKSLEVYGQLAGIEASGVSWTEALELLDEPAGSPWWRPMVEDVEPAPDALLPAGTEHGTLARVPLVDMRDLMPWLEARAEQAGVVFREGTVERLDQLDETWGAIVNCTGLGARELFDDEQLAPVRGQVVYVEDPGLERVILDQRPGGPLAYIVPFGDRVVLGGTAEEDVWEASVDPKTTERILDRCRALEPRLGEAEVLGAAAGLRPYRPQVRLEVQPREDLGPIVHNYGHGGAGVTLAWGCAREVVELLDA